MSGMALYRALVEAGAGEERAKEAAQSVVHAPEGATKADIAEVNVNVAEVNASVAGVDANIAECKVAITTALAGIRAEIAATGTRLERSIREMSGRFLTLLVASQAVLFAGLRLTGG